MPSTIQLISPVDGRVYAERQYADAAQIEQAYTRMLKGDVKYRFVIDSASLVESA